MLTKNYPSKILLLGEYTILNGSKALALPFENLSGHWSFDKVENDSAANLRSFVQEDYHQYIDQEAMKRDLDKGMWFKSTIPHGYGLGSSGALIAAIFDRFGKASKSILETKEALARMEDHFHGSSSGIDPLVSFLGRPLLIHSFNEVEVLQSKPNLEGFFLVNTNRPRQTGTLVGIYQEKIKDQQFKQGCADILSKDVNFAIDSLVRGSKSHLSHHLWHISKFQWEYFPEMIPTQMRSLWSQGLESGDFVLKLCGAGGGGYLLGYSEKLSLNALKLIFAAHEVIQIH